MVLKERSIEKKQVKFARLVLAPIKVLCGAIDVYMKAFGACAGKRGEGSVVMPSFVILPQVYPMPGNHSSSSTKKRSTKSSKDLIPVITTRNAKETISETNGGGRGKSSGHYLRSYSIGVGQIGIIDEDAPCDFVKTNGSNKSMMYPRCKSSAFQ